jgi:GTP pyrophosphokinase
MLPPGSGDRIVGLRRPGMGVEVHSIDCLELANGVSMRTGSTCRGMRARWRRSVACVPSFNRPGTLAEMAGIFAKNHANVVNLEMTQRENPFHTYVIDLEVRDLAHLTRIISALRASDAIAQADRI